MTDTAQTCGNWGHRWSGWPGAHCLDCGIPDLMEEAIALNYYDPYSEKWEENEKAQAHKALAIQHANCTIGKGFSSCPK